MSYIYSQALAAESWAPTSLASEPSAPLKLNHSLLGYCAPDKMTALSRLARYGVTFAPLTENDGEALLTSFQAAFPVRTYRQREKAWALRVNVPDFGVKCAELSVKYDPLMRSWKTAQCSSNEALSPSSVTLPKSGMMRSGKLWALTIAVPRTSEKESGFLHSIPTPTACNDPNRGGHTKGPKSLLEVARTGWCPGQKWPTPTNSDTRLGNADWQPLRKSGSKAQLTLRSAVAMQMHRKFLTPTATDALRSQFKQESLAKRWDKHPNGNLAEQIAKFPIPDTRNTQSHNSSPSTIYMVGS